MTDTQPPQEPQSIDDLLITDAAAEKIKDLLARDQKDPVKYGLRLAVQAGGCSGYQYYLDFDTASEKDAIYTHPATSVRVIVDPRSLPFLKGATLDYAEGLMGGGFQIDNPNARGGCGCGKSYEF